MASRQAGFSILLVGDAIVQHQGSLSIGPRSPERIFWATRNHLLVLERRAPLPWAQAALRRCLVVGYNTAYALTAPGTPRLAALGAVARGLRAFVSLRRL
jgi:GT2 family glycosyltransferase